MERQRVEPGPELISRARLLAVMRGRFDRRLTVLHAGSGFGKSTVLAQARAENEIERLGADVAVRLDPHDASAEVLLHLLGDELGATAPYSLDSVVDAVRDRTPTEVALVIDDAQHLDRDDGDGWTSLADLLERLPDNGHLVVSGRHRPRLPLARWQSRGEAAVLDEAELAFDADERREFATRNDATSSLADDLPVWPALATLTCAVGHRASLAYLWDEILAELDPRRIELLAALAPLGELDDDLAAALGWSGTVDELTTNLPMVERLPDGGVRLHDLWGDALARVESERLTDLHRRAAEVLLGRNDLVRAAEASVRAGEALAFERIVLALARRPQMRVSQLDVARLLEIATSTDLDVLHRRYLEAIRCQATDERLTAALLRSIADDARAAGQLELETIARWRVVQFEDLDVAGGPLGSAQLDALAGAGVPLAGAAHAFVESRRCQTAGDVDGSFRWLGGLDEFDPEQREVSLSIRLLDLGRPEALPATLESVLASGLDDIYPALAVWMQGAIDPVDAWPIARSLADRADVHTQSTRVSLQSVLAGMALQAGDPASATELLADATRRAGSAPRLVRLLADVTRALVELDQTGEDAGRDALMALLDDIPLGSWPERPYLFALTAIRALVPGGEMLDACPFGPSLTVAVEAGAAVVALRAGDPRPARSLPWDRPALLRVHVPLPLLTELALGVDEPAANDLLARLPGVRRWLTRIEQGPHASLAEPARRALGAMPHAPPYALSITTLGRFDLDRSDAAPTAGWDRRERVRQLLAVLVLRAPIERSAVSELLWPELDPDKRAANLRVNLAHLHQVLEPDRDRSDPTWFVRTPGSSLALDTEALTVDVHELERDLAAGRTAEDEGRATDALARYESAAQRYHGDLLPGLDEEWVIHERLRVRALAHNGIVRAGELRLAKGDPEVALNHAARAAQIEPLSERAHRLFVQANLACGSIDTARRAARSMETELERAGLDAEPATRALHARVGLG